MVKCKKGQQYSLLPTTNFKIQPLRFWRQGKSTTIFPQECQGPLLFFIRWPFCRWPFNGIIIIIVSATERPLLHLGAQLPQNQRPKPGIVHLVDGHPTLRIPECGTALHVFFNRHTKLWTVLKFPLKLYDLLCNMQN